MIQDFFKLPFSTWDLTCLSILFLNHISKLCGNMTRLTLCIYQIFWYHKNMVLLFPILEKEICSKYVYSVLYNKFTQASGTQDGNLCLLKKTHGLLDMKNWSTMRVLNQYSLPLLLKLINIYSIQWN